MGSRAHETARTRGRTAVEQTTPDGRLMEGRRGEVAVRRGVRRLWCCATEQAAASRGGRRIAEEWRHDFATERHQSKQFSACESAFSPAPPIRNTAAATARSSWRRSPNRSSFEGTNTKTLVPVKETVLGFNALDLQDPVRFDKATTAAAVLLLETHLAEGGPRRMVTGKQNNGPVVENVHSLQHRHVAPGSTRFGMNSDRRG